MSGPSAFRRSVSAFLEPRFRPKPEECLRGELMNVFKLGTTRVWMTKGDGDGATGTIVIDPVAGKIVNAHGWYFTDVNYETKEF